MAINQCRWRCRCCSQPPKLPIPPALPPPWQVLPSVCPGGRTTELLAAKGQRGGAKQKIGALQTAAAVHTDGKGLHVSLQASESVERPGRCAVLPRGWLGGACSAVQAGPAKSHLHSAPACLPPRLPNKPQPAGRCRYLVRLIVPKPISAFSTVDVAAKLATAGEKGAAPFPHV